jgi:bacillolysin
MRERVGRLVVSAAIASMAFSPGLAAAQELPRPDETDFERDERNQSADPGDSEVAGATELMLDKVESGGGIGERLKMKRPRQELEVKFVDKDRANVWHFRLAQKFEGIPVRDGGVVIHIDEADLDAEPRWHGEYLEDPEVDTRAKIPGSRAIAALKTHLTDRHGSRVRFADERPDGKKVKGEGIKPTAHLEIHPGDGPGRRILSYNVRVRAEVDGEPVLAQAWVDQDGNVLEMYNDIQTSHCEAGVGRTFYQGTRTSYFNVAYSGGRYVLNDNCLRIGTYDMYGGTDASSSQPGTAYQVTSYSTTFGNNALSDRNSTSADAHWSTVQTAGFFSYVLGRNFVDGFGGPRVYPSVDGAGPLISVRNHYGVKYNNAFWDPGLKMIALGDGDGSKFRSFSDLDLVAHEWTHGLIEHTAKLKYLNESGALNEGFADIMGAMAERYYRGESFNTWKIFENIYTPGVANDAARYMFSPTLDGSSRDHYSQRYVGTLDNGGVHWNSGIVNNAFYLLSTGSCHRFSGCMTTGIGANAATQIYWRALRTCLYGNDGFSWARQCTLWAAEDLYGKFSTPWQRVRQSWSLVGVPAIYD